MSSYIQLSWMFLISRAAAFFGKHNDKIFECLQNCWVKRFWFLYVGIKNRRYCTASQPIVRFVCSQLFKWNTILLRHDHMNCGPGFPKAQGGLMQCMFVLPTASNEYKLNRTCCMLVSLSIFPRWNVFLSFFCYELLTIRVFLWWN